MVGRQRLDRARRAGQRPCGTYDGTGDGPRTGRTRGRGRGTGPRSRRGPVIHAHRDDPGHRAGPGHGRRPRQHAAGECRVARRAAGRPRQPEPSHLDHRRRRRRAARPAGRLHALRPRRGRRCRRRHRGGRAQDSDPAGHDRDDGRDDQQGPHQRLQGRAGPRRRSRQGPGHPRPVRVQVHQRVAPGGPPSGRRRERQGRGHRALERGRRLRLGGQREECDGAVAGGSRALPEDVREGQRGGRTGGAGRRHAHAVWTRPLRGRSRGQHVVVAGQGRQGHRLLGGPARPQGRGPRHHLGVTGQGDDDRRPEDARHVLRRHGQHASPRPDRTVRVRWGRGPSSRIGSPSCTSPVGRKPYCS